LSRAAILHFDSVQKLVVLPQLPNEYVLAFGHRKGDSGNKHLNKLKTPSVHLLGIILNLQEFLTTYPITTKL
jgi:hypothetical protein